MDYVGRLKFRDSAGSEERDAALARRLGWQYPDGVQLIAEYWPLSADLTVVTIFSTDDYAAMWQVVAEWTDVFEVEVSPAISADEGMKVGPDVWSRLSRLHT
jgi:hypothetical protein